MAGRDRECRCRDGETDLRRARVELARERRQKRLRAIQIEERAKSRNADRGATEALIHVRTRLMAGGVSANAEAIASAGERSPGMTQRLGWRARRIKLSPSEGAELVCFLLPDNGRDSPMLSKTCGFRPSVRRISSVY